MVAQSYHDTVLSGKLSQAVRQATDREGGGGLLLYYQCMKTGRPVTEVLREKHPDTQVPPMEKKSRAHPSRRIRRFPKLLRQLVFTGLSMPLRQWM